MAVVRSTYGGGSAKKGAGERAELQGPREALSGHVGEEISDMSPYRRPRRHRRQGGRRRERGSGETRLADLQTPQPNKRTNRRKRQHQQHDAHTGAFWVSFLSWCVRVASGGPRGRGSSAGSRVWLVGIGQGGCQGEGSSFGVSDIAESASDNELQARSTGSFLQLHSATPRESEGFAKGWTRR